MMARTDEQIIADLHTAISVVHSDLVKGFARNNQDTYEATRSIADYLHALTVTALEGLRLVVESLEGEVLS